VIQNVSLKAHFDRGCTTAVAESGEQTWDQSVKPQQLLDAFSAQSGPP